MMKIFESNYRSDIDHKVDFIQSTIQELTDINSSDEMYADPDVNSVVGRMYDLASELDNILALKYR